MYSTPLLIVAVDVMLISLIGNYLYHDEATHRNQYTCTLSSLLEVHNVIHPIIIIIATPHNKVYTSTLTVHTGTWPPAL